MKKTTTLAALIVSLLFVASLGFGCSSPSNSADKPSGEVVAEETDKLPGLQPIDHKDRFVTLGGADGCYTCHGNGPAGNPNTPDSTATPADHYVDQSIDSMQFSPDYAQCISCHPLSNS